MSAPGRRKALLAAAALAFPLAMALAATEPDMAADLVRRFPVASIQSRAAAEQALAAADRADHAAQSTFDAQRAACARKFLATSCLDTARRRLNVAQREILRIQVEAHDWQRAADAAQRRGDALDQARHLAEDRVAHMERGRQAQLKAGANPAGAGAAHGASAGPAPADAAANRARYDNNQAAHASDRARAASAALAAERQENARQYEIRRRDAAAHALQVEQDRRDKESQREERRKKLEADEKRRLDRPAAAD